MSKFLSAITLLLAVSSCAAFGITSKLQVASGRYHATTSYTPMWMAEKEKSTTDDGVIELVDTDDEGTTDSASSSEESKEAAVAPFLSQGEIQEETLKVDLSDPKQTRVIVYIILSLLPILFLIPLMLGSREFLPAIIPMDDLPPVQM